MKRLILVLLCSLAAMSFQVGAATCVAGVDCGEISDNADLGRSNIVGEFSDTYTFTVPADNVGGSFSVTNSFVSLTNAGFIENFRAFLNGVALSLTNVAGTQVLFLDLGSPLSSTVHTLLIQGTGLQVGRRTSSYGGSIQIDSSSETPEVPLPAAFWLFGSALLGLFGIKRRQA